MWYTIYGVVYHQVNVSSHTSLATRQKLRELGFIVPAPSDYHLFKHLKNCWDITKTSFKITRFINMLNKYELNVG